MQRWRFGEQVEEESTFNTLITKLSRNQNDSNALFMLYEEVANRTFTPPAE